MADFLAGSEATFVTNSIPLAQKLARSGSRIYILPGRVKGDTEAIVGSEMRDMIGRYLSPKGSSEPMGSLPIPAVRRQMMKKLSASALPSASAWTASSWPIPVNSVYLRTLLLQIYQWLR